jgi:hypothetical protein
VDLFQGAEIVSHVFIATSGCAGSSLLMAILTKLGMDTGVEFQGPNNILRGKPSFGGQYEVKIHGKQGQANSKHFPYIIKSRRICWGLSERIDRWDLKVDYVYGLLRGPTFFDAVKERAERNKPEGFWEKKMADPNSVEKINAELRRIEKNFLMLCLNLAKLDIPHTMLAYPDYAINLSLTYKKLNYLMTKYSISYEKFEQVCNELIDKELLNYG